MAMSAEHRSKFAALQRQRWRLHVSEKFSSGTIQFVWFLGRSSPLPSQGNMAEHRVRKEQSRDKMGFKNYYVQKSASTVRNPVSLPRLDITKRLHNDRHFKFYKRLK